MFIEKSFDQFCNSRGLTAKHSCSFKNKSIFLLSFQERAGNRCNSQTKEESKSAPKKYPTLPNSLQSKIHQGSNFFAFGSFHTKNILAEFQHGVMRHRKSPKSWRFGFIIVVHVRAVGFQKLLSTNSVDANTDCSLTKLHLSVSRGRQSSTFVVSKVPSH